MKNYSDFPLSGRLVPELRTDRYREIIISPCRVVYTATLDAIIILRMLRGERLLKPNMLPSN